MKPLLRNDIQPALWIDHELHAMKIGQESRVASQQMGRQVVKIAVEPPDAHVVVDEIFMRRWRRNARRVIFPVSLGLTLANAGWDKMESHCRFLLPNSCWVCVGGVETVADRTA